MDFDRDFGVNQVFVEDLYERWRGNPTSVEETWQKYFAGLSGFDPRSWSAPPPPRQNGSTGGAAANGNGHAVAAYQGYAGVREPSAIDVAAVEQIPETRLQAKLAQEGVSRLIEAYRTRGHLYANLDPLGFGRREPSELSLDQFGLSDADLDRTFATTDLVAPQMGPATATLREIVARLRRTYCRSIGVEYMHGEDPATRRWLQERMEGSSNELLLSREERRNILARLTDAEVLESFLHKRYQGAKRFSVEGGESLIPLFDWLIEESAERGVEEMVIGMAHRGRLNVLTNVLGKRPHEIFAEFEDRDAQALLGRGDVKYHMGHSSDRRTRSGRNIHLSLAFNPSHLEFVNAVVEGRVRAKQDRQGREPDRKRVVPVLVHGDAAFAGQGIVAECLNLASLEGYQTGGTIHIVINNQVGFTTNPEDSRSTPYCTDIARVLRAPVFHVNGEDPEAVVWTVKLAVEYRQTFGQDVLIDLYCYRKYGHNEGDEPGFTQPKMYEVIRAKKTPREIYAQRLVEAQAIEAGEPQRLSEEVAARLDAAFEQTRSSGAKRAVSPMAGLWSNYRGGPDGQTPEVKTAVPDAQLRELLRKLSQVPSDFTPHEKIAKLLADRRKLADSPSGAIDWGTAEHLALASLLAEGTSIRFSGQDARRGTFSHRHATLTDVKTGARHTPLNHLREGQTARIDIYDSPLSEQGVLGFDYGFSLDTPDWLTCWEAQFGDFANGAQVIIDQFLSSAEDKWNRLSNLVMLLPHGFEGQGPEHSSARLERYLGLCAEDNLQVCNLTTPANFFHALRRQVLRPWRKPLIVMTPKSLLRAKAAVSTMADLAEGGFSRIIPDALEPKGVRRVLLCSGKVFYDLEAYRAAKKLDDVAIVRLEQLYPLSEELLTQVLGGYKKGTELWWVQEEPFNMGAWYFLRARWPEALIKKHGLRCVARPESASPATGSLASHKFEQQQLVEEAFAAAK